MRKTIKELLAEFDPEGKHAYTRERFDADRARLVARLCEKHNIAEAEIDALIREHRYVHTDEDPRGRVDKDHGLRQCGRVGPRTNEQANAGTKAT